MTFGEKIAAERKKIRNTQDKLAKKTGTISVIIGRYERDEIKLSIEVAKKIADAFEVSLDYLVGEGQNASFDKKTLQRIHDLELLEENKKKTLFDLIDTFLRDSKARKAYA